MTSPPEHADWPAWATEDVHLAEYDRAWRALAARYAEELQPALAPWLLAPVEHVGSTAIPGLIAKPVIDVMALVASLDPAVAATESALRSLDWEYVPATLDHRPFRRFFVKVSPDGRRRQAHLHLMAAGTPRWDEQLRFRDALRASARLRDEYATLKSELARTHARDRERYTDEKSAFVAQVLGTS